MLARCASEDDAEPAADLVRRSIAELCAAEYRYDPAVLARWLAEKTPADFRRWIASSDRSVCVVVERDGQLAAAGMVVWRGEIVLNFVAPQARFRGASKMLMAHMEDHLWDRGARQVSLFSTHLARRFYHSLGYEEVGFKSSRFGTLDMVEMMKCL